MNERIDRDQPDSVRGNLEWDWQALAVSRQTDPEITAALAEAAEVLYSISVFERNGQINATYLSRYQHEVLTYISDLLRRRQMLRERAIQGAIIRRSVIDDMCGGGQDEP